MDRRRHRRQTSNYRRAAHLRSLQKPQRVLGRSAGESLRQVWTSRLCDSAIFCGGGGAGLLTSPVCCRVCGSYADMNAGTPAEALVDFTGGVHICVQLSDPPSNLWELMCRAGEASSLMGCGTDGVKKHSAHETSMLKHVKRTKV